LGVEIRVESVTADTAEGIVEVLQEKITHWVNPEEPAQWRLVDSSPLSVFTGPDGKVHAVVVLTRGKSKIWRW
jgi:hypothetical protein